MYTWSWMKLGGINIINLDGLLRDDFSGDTSRKMKKFLLQCDKLESDEKVLEHAWELFGVSLRDPTGCMDVVAWCHEAALGLVYLWFLKMAFRKKIREDGKPFRFSNLFHLLRFVLVVDSSSRRMKTAWAFAAFQVIKTRKCFGRSWHARSQRLFWGLGYAVSSVVEVLGSWSTRLWHHWSYMSYFVQAWHATTQLGTRLSD